jgi:hypothetical protein
MRDRDVRNAMRLALINTGAFDGVWIWGLPEDCGSGASQLAAAAIEPAYGEQFNRWDSEAGGGLVVRGTIQLTLLYRSDDPQIRDEGAELLLYTAANALNGQSLAGLTLPGLTYITNWAWQRPTPPERRIQATLSYQYVVEGWDSYDETV